MTKIFCSHCLKELDDKTGWIFANPGSVSQQQELCKDCHQEWKKLVVRQRNEIDIFLNL